MFKSVDQYQKQKDDLSMNWYSRGLPNTSPKKMKDDLWKLVLGSTWKIEQKTLTNDYGVWQVLTHSSTKVEEITSGQCRTWAFVATKRGFVKSGVLFVFKFLLVCVFWYVSLCVCVYIYVIVCVCVYMSSCVSVNCGMWMCCSTSNWVDRSPLPSIHCGHTQGYRSQSLLM